VVPREQVASKAQVVSEELVVFKAHLVFKVFKEPADHLV
jgi:hypothetical protein